MKPKRSPKKGILISGRLRKDLRRYTLVFTKVGIPGAISPAEILRALQRAYEVVLR